jgi:hypothetical protein
MAGEPSALKLESQPRAGYDGAGTSQARRERAAPSEVLSVHATVLGSGLAWTAAGAVLVNWSVQLLSAVTVYPWVALLVIVAGLWGVLTALVCWLPLARRPRFLAWRGVAAWGTVAVVIGCYATWAFLQIHASPGYGTDEIAFDQYAAVLARHGIDPYTRSLLPAFGLYHVSPDGFTYHLDGTPVTSLSYPALAFLFYVPFMALGWSTQLAVVLNAVAWAVAVVLLFVALPRPFRPVALVIGSIATYSGYALGGVTDMLYIPLLIGAAYRWTSFVQRRGWRRYIGPVLLGLAMAVKQTPWLVAPFVLLGIVLEARATSEWRTSLRTAGAYVLVAALAFAIPNLFYLVESPAAWLQGILTPFESNVVPAGQGAVGLSLYLRLGGGSITAYTLLTASVLVALLLLYAVTYPLARPATFLLASVVLFFAARSFGSYLVALIPVALVGAVTTARRADLTPSSNERSAPTPWRVGEALGRKKQHFLLGLAGALPLGALAYALSAQPPLRVQVTGLRSTGQLATVEQLTVKATNETTEVMRPHFSVDEGGAPTTFWQVASGPSRIRPRTSATFILRAPNFPAQPSIGGGFQVVAYTTSPATVSESASYLPSPEHLALSPVAINHVVPLGVPVVVSAQLLNQFDRPIHEAGVPVYLGQVIYDQLGLLYSEAVINGRPPGQTPVSAYTNDDGVATFTIVGTQSSQDPVYFEANLVSPQQFYPYGYSQILAIRFSAR